MLTAEKKRIAYIDIARALAIILVIFGHTFSSGPEKKLIYSFHMPLFFLISGMLMRLKQPEFTVKDLTLLLWKRFCSYYIPYTIWALLYSTLTFRNLFKVLYGTREALVQIDSITPIWFLPALFAATCIAESILFLVRKSKNPILPVCSGICVLFLIGFNLPHIKPYGYPMAFDIALIAAAFLLLGWLLVRFNFSGFLTNKKKSAVSFVAFTAAYLAAYYLCPNTFPKGMYRVSMYMNGYGNPLIFLLHALTGSLMLLCFSALLDQLLPRQRLLSWIGENTMGILVLHKLFIELGRVALNRIGMDAASTPAVCLIVLFAVIGSSVGTRILLTAAPFLLGKKQ